ncbi:MAG: VOC family protein, partial [Pseudomonadota bacterium]
MLTSTNAIFCCLDMDRTVAFYESLGFKLQYRYEEEGYLIFLKDSVELHFARNPSHIPEQSQHAAYFRTAEVDAWSDSLAKLDWKSEGFPRFGAA